MVAIFILNSKSVKGEPLVIQTSNTTVTVKTLEIDGKKLSKTALAKLGIVDFTDTYAGALSGRYQFIAKFPIEIFAKLAIAKEKILPESLLLPSREALSDSSSEVSGCCNFRQKAQGFMY